MTKIFIQIAAYRDTELLPTLDSLLSNAKYPENLTFGLVWQHDRKDVWDHLNQYISDKRFRILDIPYDESGGMGWARSKTQSLYDGEDYTIQIDSHMRFSKNWDSELLIMMDGLMKISNKPIISAYAYDYVPENDQNLQNITSTLCPIAFKSNGILFFKGYANKPNEYSKPYKARLVGGHYFFTVGKHCIEYKYDPNLYYVGDEITLAVRSFTMGYDLYHPHKCLLWHYYKRQKNNKHWDDVEQAKKDTKERYNIQRIRQMFGLQDYGIDLENYGLGDIRTLADYEKYSGIYIRDQRIQTSAMNGIEPPVKVKNKYLLEKGFIKYFTVQIKDFQQQFLIQQKNNIDYMKLDLISLDRQIIHQQTIPMFDIQPNSVIDIKYTGEKKAVVYNLECYKNGIDKPKIKITKDLEDNLQWI